MSPSSAAPCLLGRAVPIVCTYPEELMGTPEAKALADRAAVQGTRCTSKNLLLLKALVLSGRAAARGCWCRRISEAMQQPAC